MRSVRQLLLRVSHAARIRQTLAEAEVVSKSSLLIYLAPELRRHRWLAAEHMEILRHLSLSLCGLSSVADLDWLDFLKGDSGIKKYIS